MSDIKINVSDYTRVPGGRFKDSGDNSAEEFFERFLLPHIDDQTTGTITIDFSNTWGYPVSFTSQLGLYLKDALGSLDAVKRRIVAVADDDSEVVTRFWKQLEEES